MTDTPNGAEKKKRFRSPAYPAIDLAKAVERTAALMKLAHHHQVGVSVVLQAWDMDSDAGPVWRYLAALIQYGLVTDTGTGKARKFQVTDVARRIVQDNDPNSSKRKDALKTAALSPVIHKELWEKYGAATGLSDAVLKAYLTLDRTEGGQAPYSEFAASEVVQAYKASLAFAGLPDSDKVETSDTDKKPESSANASSKTGDKISVGDYVRWTSHGMDQFDARKVEWVSPDGSHLRVFGSPTGIPMNEATVVMPPGRAAPVSPPLPPVVSSRGDGAKSPNITVYQQDGRLQITADVDLQGIEKLETMLAKYKEILKLMN